MSVKRLNDVLRLDKAEVSALFAAFDASSKVLDFALITDNMSNTGYAVTTASGRYLLKIYSNTTDKIETAVYRYLKGKINVPELLYYDDSRARAPYVYAIFEYLEGDTLRHYVRTNRMFQADTAREIGRMCGVIHCRNYRHDALLNGELTVQEPIPDTRERILFLLEGKPRTYLRPETVKQLRDFIWSNTELFDRISAESILCHGDFNMGNIMISGGNVYFIDFEFAYAGSRYHDIGQFFRKKGQDIQALIDKSVYDGFSAGYCAGAGQTLPQDWLRLARLCDIAPMLCLLDRDNIPADWGSDVEQDILRAIETDKKI